MKCLFVCHDPPAPANNGGSIDMLGMLEGLARIGADVHLVVTSKDADTPIDMPRLSRSASAIDVVHRNLGPLAAAALTPYQIASRRRLKDMPLRGPYDVVIASDHCSGVFFNPNLRARHRILRRNNNESMYAKRMAADEPNAARRLIFLKESVLFRRWTRRVDAMADQVWYASEAEMKAERAAASSPKPARLSVPPAIDPGVFRVPNLESIAAGRVLYFGSFTIAVNREGVEWFIEQVHPRLLERLPKYQLVVAGRVGPAEQAWAARYAGRKDLQFVANPDDPAQLYGPGGVFVDPRAHDVGIKVKILEAVRHGFAVVCSDNSLVGSGLSAGAHARTANSVNEFVEQMATVLADPAAAYAMAGKAQAVIKQYFDVDRNMKQALELLQRPQLPLEQSA